VARRSHKVLAPRRGEVYLVRLDPTVGHEIRKTRPAAVVQADPLNRGGATTIVAPLTSNTSPPLHLTRVFVPRGKAGLAVDSMVLTRQLRAVDVARLVRRLGVLTSATMHRVDRALRLTLDLASTRPASRRV